MGTVDYSRHRAGSFSVPKSCPRSAAGIGQAISNFKKASSEPDEIDVTPKADKEEKKED